eukprot:m.49213 g.49213  ORF g.49213 m.49213 type:complete len:367 (+) comp12057_c1_seq1:594-1694(+)
MPTDASGASRLPRPRPSFPMCSARSTSATPSRWAALFSPRSCRRPGMTLPGRCATSTPRAGRSASSCRRPRTVPRLLLVSCFPARFSTLVPSRTPKAPPSCLTSPTRPSLSSVAPPPTAETKAPRSPPAPVLDVRCILKNTATTAGMRERPHFGLRLRLVSGRLAVRRWKLVVSTPRVAWPRRRSRLRARFPKATYWCLPRPCLSRARPRTPRCLHASARSRAAALSFSCSRARTLPARPLPGGPSSGWPLRKVMARWPTPLATRLLTVPPSPRAASAKRTNPSSSATPCRRACLLHRCSRRLATTPRPSASAAWRTTRPSFSSKRIRARTMSSSTPPRLLHGWFSPRSPEVWPAKLQLGPWQGHM